MAGVDEALRAAPAMVYVSDLRDISLSEEDEHHLLRVLRLRDGETVIACDGNGHFVRCAARVEGSTRPPGNRRFALAALDAVETAPPPTRPVAVGLSLHKGERPDWAVQKLTEVGVDQIVLFFSERTVVRPDDGDRRLERLRRVARGAAAQSRRLRLPAVEGPFNYEEALGRLPAVAAVAEPGAPPLRAGVSSILVGPEGGFTDRELALAPAQVGLAKTVLRTETAAVAGGVLLAGLRDGRIRSAIGPSVSPPSVAN